MAQAGEVIFAAGAPADAVFQLAMGAVRFDGPEGSKVLRAEDLPGGFLGLEAFLRNRPHTSTATAEEACFLAVIGAGHREAFLRSHPALALNLLERP
jgi:CRP-like cAMP-binding protein